MTTGQKLTPLFTIFAQQDGKNRRVGAAFKHKKGPGFNFVIGGNRFSAFPPKAKPAKQEQGKEDGA